MRKFLTVILIFTAGQISAQDSVKTNLQWSAYLESYYSYDFGKPPSGNRPAFLYSHNRHNEFNINLAYLKTAYASANVRANLSLAAGTYMNANYAAEPGVLKNIFEADAGVKLSRHNELWLDAGIFPSHIGFESAVSKDCRTVTRSILAENSPYFESGAKIGYTSKNGKWFASLLALNGWQRITRLPGNAMMSWGVQVQYKPSDRVLINYSNFYGTDKPDSARLIRFFHNFYSVITLNAAWELTAGFDTGTEQKAKGSASHNTWFSPVCILRYQPSAKWALALRGEYYQDKNGVIISTGTPNGFCTGGYSFNTDYQPAKNIWLRIEYRHLKSRDAVFADADGLQKINQALTASVAVAF